MASNTSARRKDALRTQNDGLDGLSDLLGQAFGAADCVLDEGAPNRHWYGGRSSVRSDGLRLARRLAGRTV